MVHISHACAARVIKGEDTVKAIRVSSPEHDCTTAGWLFLVCDGHGGVHAANFVCDHFHRHLAGRLPADVFRAIDAEDYEKAAPDIRQALCEAFVVTDNRWVEVGHMAGSTVTAVLVLGSLLTVANIGDSESVLDTGCSILELTHSHRLQTNVAEQTRLKKAGCTVAPYGFHLQGPAKPGEAGVGPQRVWPGGLCVARSIGDADAGPEVVPVPHVKQLIVPAAGCRFMLASDGLWDVYSFTKAVRLIRKLPTQAAAAELIRVAALETRVIDDTSVIVVDVLPDKGTSFPEVAASMPQVVAKSSGGMCGCFAVELDEPDSRDVSGAGRLDFFADIDGLVAYPQLKARLARNSFVTAGRTSRQHQQRVAAQHKEERRQMLLMEAAKERAAAAEQRQQPYVQHSPMEQQRLATATTDKPTAADAAASLPPQPVAEQRGTGGGQHVTVHSGKEFGALMKEEAKPHRLVSSGFSEPT